MTKFGFSAFEAGGRCLCSRESRLFRGKGLEFVACAVAADAMFVFHLFMSI